MFFFFCRIVVLWILENLQNPQKFKRNKNYMRLSTLKWYRTWCKDLFTQLWEVKFLRYSKFHCKLGKMIKIIQDLANNCINNNLLIINPNYTLITPLKMKKKMINKRKSSMTSLICFIENIDSNNTTWQTFSCNHIQ